MLCSDHAPLVASFLNRMFVAPNVRTLSQADLKELLEDQLFELREWRGAGAFPKSALEYLNDWAGNDKAWLRKFYPAGSDEAHFDLTPAAASLLRGVMKPVCSIRSMRIWKKSSISVSCVC